MKQKKIIITGGLGFLGFSIFKKLINENLFNIFPALLRRKLFLHLEIYQKKFKIEPILNKYDNQQF